MNAIVKLFYTKGNFLTALKTNSKKSLNTFNNLRKQLKFYDYKSSKQIFLFQLSNLIYMLKSTNLYFVTFKLIS